MKFFIGTGRKTFFFSILCHIVLKSSETVLKKMKDNLWFFIIDIHVGIGTDLRYVRKYSISQPASGIFLVINFF
jgi:hypothetical protein